MKCGECGGKLVMGSISYYYKGKDYFGDFEVERCSKCGTEFITEKTYDEIERIARLKKLWGSNPKQTFDGVPTASIPDAIGIVPVTAFIDRLSHRYSQATIAVK